MSFIFQLLHTHVMLLFILCIEQTVGVHPTLFLIINDAQNFYLLLMMLVSIRCCLKIHLEQKDDLLQKPVVIQLPMTIKNKKLNQKIFSKMNILYCSYLCKTMIPQEKMHLLNRKLTFLVKLKKLCERWLQFL